MLQPPYGPELLKDFDCAQNLGHCLFEPVLSIPNPGVQLHRTTKVECMINRVRLGLFEVRVRVVELVFITKEFRQ